MRAVIDPEKGQLRHVKHHLALGCNLATIVLENANDDEQKISLMSKGRDRQGPCLANALSLGDAKGPIPAPFQSESQGPGPAKAHRLGDAKVPPRLFVKISCSLETNHDDCNHD